MRVSTTFKMPFRRRLEKKTNYRRRLKLIKSNKTRMVIRRSNKGFLVQFIDYDPKGDITKLTVRSKALEKLGFPAKRNTPTAYLTGIYAAKEAIKKGIEEAIVDATDIKNGVKKGSNIMALIKGAIDGGLKIPYDDSFIIEERIEGKHISDDVNKKFLEVKEKLLK